MAKNKWDAQDYAKHSSAQWKWAEELIHKLQLNGTEHVLDIGCGDGKISAALAQKLEMGSITGVDASPEMIALAQKEFNIDLWPNLDFKVMDAADIRLDKKYDIAFSNATLHWVADHGAVLAGINACLNPNGKILLQMGGAGNAQAMIDIVTECIDTSGWSDYFTGFEFPYYFYAVADYQNWLPQHGFIADRVELLAKDMQHEGIDGLKGWLRTTWFPYTDRLPDHLKELFLDEIVSVYLKKFPVDTHGKTHVRMVRLEVDATKCK
ncbi:methyltransferase domain-containing protein [candidate division KSB1 bacterium]|nr:methyltransferase domain-containing protein [candidate division KSB1 bacterium]